MGRNPRLTGVELAFIPHSEAFGRLIDLTASWKSPLIPGLYLAIAFYSYKEVNPHGLTQRKLL
jgi:hypothetical protein